MFTRWVIKRIATKTATFRMSRVVRPRHIDYYQDTWLRRHDDQLVSVLMKQIVFPSKGWKAKDKYGGKRTSKCGGISFLAVFCFNLLLTLHSNNSWEFNIIKMIMDINYARTVNFCKNNSIKGAVTNLLKIKQTWGTLNDSWRGKRGFHSWLELIQWALKDTARQFIHEYPNLASFAYTITWQVIFIAL